jgi:hypothetical protein
MLPILSASPAGPEKPFVLDRMPLRRLIETAFEVGKHQIGGAQFRADLRKRHRWIVDIHQVHIADQDHRGHAGTPPVRGLAISKAVAIIDPAAWRRKAVVTPAGVSLGARFRLNQRRNNNGRERA